MTIPVVCLVYTVAVRSQSTHPTCSNTTIAELSKGSNTLLTDSTNLQVTMQHKSGAALIWRDKALFLFSILSANPMEAPHIPHASPSQTVFDFLSQRHNRLCHSFWIIWTTCWLAKTSNKPISLTTWLVVNPLNKGIS